MSAALLSTAQFFTTVAHLHQLPAADLPEVAFVGRSNAGKSSAINRLCNRNRLAFASRTPGRTQALNFFSLGDPAAGLLGYLVDTPGYGFAAAPGEIRRQWSTLAGRYLGGRAQLRGVVLTVDIRRLVGERDVDLLRWIAPDVPILVLLTKADKLARMHQRRALDQARDQIAALRLPNPVSMLLFSSLKGLGLEAARAQIAAWLVPPEPDGTLGDDAARGDEEPARHEQSDFEPASGPAPIRGKA
jgi:GTP-binding protein